MTDIANGSVKKFGTHGNFVGNDILSKLESIQLIRQCVLWFAASMAVYIFWIFNISIAPILLLLLLAAILNEIKKDKEKRLNQAQSFSVIGEKALVHSTFKPNNVPPWILFPDKVKDFG